MRIYCPNCNTGYEINEELIKDKARKVKCSNCGKIFEAGSLKSATPVNSEESNPENPFDALSSVMKEENVSAVRAKDTTNAEEINVKADVNVNDDIEQNTNSVSESDEVAKDDTDNSTDVENKQEKTVISEDEVVSDDIKEDAEVNIESIFERLSEHTEKLIEKEKKLPFYEKMWLQIKNVLGFHFKVRWSYIFVGLLAFVAISLYNNRYDVVRKVSFMNEVYKFFGIKAKIPGEGLEFQNISWNFVTDDENTRLEIKGFVYNKTANMVDIPTIHIEILDKATSLLQSQNRKIKETTIDANNKIPLDLVIVNPAPTAKYVYLTFIDKD